MTIRLPAKTVPALNTPVVWSIQSSIAMASEIGFIGRRLLTSCTVHGTHVQASRAVLKPLWAQRRNFSTLGNRLNNENNNDSSSGSRFAANEPSNWTIPAQRPPPPPLSSNTATPTSKKPDSPFEYDATRDPFDLSKIIAMESDEFLQKHYPTTQRQPEIRTRPVTGRTFQVGAGRDFSTAIRTLEINVRKNRIKHLWHTQKRHERPGLKRKRLKAQRFAKRFREGFAATVRRVQELTNQGW